MAACGRDPGQRKKRDGPWTNNTGVPGSLTHPASCPFFPSYTSQPTAPPLSRGAGSQLWCCFPRDLIEGSETKREGLLTGNNRIQNEG